MREVTINPKLTDIVQHSSKTGTTEITDLKDTFFTPNLEEDPIETPRHELSAVTKEENK